MLYQSGTKFNLISNSGKVLKTLPQGFYKIVMTQHGMWLEQMQDPFKGMFLRLERLIVPKNSYTNLSLTY